MLNRNSFKSVMQLFFHFPSNFILAEERNNRKVLTDLPKIPGLDKPNLKVGRLLEISVDTRYWYNTK